MRTSVQITTRSSARSALAGRVPRVAVGALIAVFALAGVRASVAGPPQAQIRPATEPRDFAGAESFAEAFVRAYLGWDAERPEAHERGVARYVSSALSPGAGFSVPDRGREVVVWTAIVANRLDGPQRVVTVAAQTTKRTTYLAVPIRRSQSGLLIVAGYPAIVGAPASDRSYAPTEGAEVEDVALRAVATRAVRNYLEGEKANLLADLAPDAVLGLPNERLALRSVDEVTSAGAGRVAVLVEATTRDGAALNLRYVLSVAKRDRWYVRSIQGDVTTSKGGIK